LIAGKRRRFGTMRDPVFLSGVNMKRRGSFAVIVWIICSLLPAQAAVREYFIAAEKVEWNYAPSGKNLMYPQRGLGVWGKQLRYMKYRYVQYTDANFTEKVPHPEWLGILGTQLEVVEGDTLKVHFLNRADKPLSIHPHGLHYDKANESADGYSGGAYVKPGESFAYTWTANQHAAPGPNDPSSIVWLYHSHVDSPTEVNDGLIGTIIVTRKGMARSAEDPRPKDVDRAFTTLFMIFNESEGKMVVSGRNNKSRVLQVVAQSESAREGHLKHAINGYIFANLPGLTIKKGERVRWYLVALGSEQDLHTAHWHGQTVLWAGQRTDVIDLLPASMKTVDMEAVNPGHWMYHCHVNDHIDAGMYAHWVVEP
jgi:manganese oxidase